jgi:hypothetical protein
MIPKFSWGWQIQHMKINYIGRSEVNRVIYPEECEIKDHIVHFYGILYQESADIVPKSR